MNARRWEGEYCSLCQFAGEGSSRTLDQMNLVVDATVWADISVTRFVVRGCMVFPRSRVGLYAQFMCLVGHSSLQCSSSVSSWVRVARLHWAYCTTTHYSTVSSQLFSLHLHAWLPWLQATIPVYRWTPSQSVSMCDRVSGLLYCSLCLGQMEVGKSQPGYIL